MVSGLWLSARMFVAGGGPSKFSTKKSEMKRNVARKLIEGNLTQGRMHPDDEIGLKIE